MHAIAPDPYNPGHVYMTMGDGGAREWMRSTDYGATWVNLSISSTWQAVQISFSKDWVWGAGDSQNGHIILLDRETCTPRMGTLGSIKNMAVPAAAAVTDKFYVNAWYATVDPSTEVYYMTANDTSIAGSNTGGLFATPSIGSAPVLLDKFGTSAETPIEVVPFTGCVWCGHYKRPLL